MKRPVRIANVSGFFGDRPSAMREQLTGGSVDVLTGDYLAELTMLILARTQERRPDGGYARTFVTELTGVLDIVMDQGVKVVVNAGGLDPLGCASAVRQVASERGLAPVVAAVTGDDLMERLDDLGEAGEDFRNLQTGMVPDLPFMTANAYLGGWGITDALQRGADIVVTGRVTDAALVSGVAAWWHGWSADEYDRLAGAVVAGHIIECGLQATGGNFSFFDEIEALTYPGFPWAEIADDGSCLIGKHAGTGGAVTRETVISQLLYEIASPIYLNPDVSARFDTVQVEEVEADRVRVSGTRGQAPPPTLKVAASVPGGYRNVVTIGLTGLDQAAKAQLLHDQIWRVLPGEPADFDEVDECVIGSGASDPTTNPAAVSFWQLSVASSDEAKVGRAFSNAAIQTVLGSIPGMFSLSPPSGSTAFGRYWPTSVDRRHIVQTVHLGGASHAVTERTPGVAEESYDLADVPAWSGQGPTVPVAFGRVYGTRSGDKGGSANLGVFARTEESFGWLVHFLTVEALTGLLPELTALRVERFVLPNLWSVNFVVHGLLGDGVSSSLRLDPQGKGLGEYLRAKIVPVPGSLLSG